MPDSGAIQTFKDGRTSLRETAKWLMSGIAAASTLTVGSAAFSQLGSLPLGGRFLTAVAALTVAAVFWWKPFMAAVRVLKSEMLSLQDFMRAQANSSKLTDEETERAKVLKAADAKLNGFLPFGSIEAMVAECNRLRGVVFAEQRGADPPLTKSASAKQLEALAPLEIFALETCSAALVSLRFDALVDALWRFGSLSLIGFAVFAWAANPPKDVAPMLDKPLDISGMLSAERKTLKDAGVDAACSNAGASLIVVSGTLDGPKTALLVPPHPIPKGCPVQKVTLSANYKVLELN